MGKIFLNSGNSKTSDLHSLVLNLMYKKQLQIGDR